MPPKKNFTALKDGRYVLTKDRRTIFFDNSKQSWPGVADNQSKLAGFIYVTIKELEDFVKDARKRLDKSNQLKVVCGRIDGNIEFLIHEKNCPKVVIKKDKIFIKHKKNASRSKN